jgi:hypothetical protein
MIIYQKQALSGTCGIGLLYAFSEYYSYKKSCMPSWYTPQPKTSGLDYNTFSGGSGWNIAGFINTHVCKEAYEILRKKYKIVFQAPRRKNRNSDNSFFFVVYDSQRAKAQRPRWTGKSKGAPKPQALIDWETSSAIPIDNSQYKWPWN